MSYCPNFKGVLTAHNSDGKKMATVVRCKSWYCPTCAPLNRLRWQAVLLDHINKSECKTWAWFTLTAHENAHNTVNPAKYTLKNISRAWDRLIKRMRRKFGRFEYCRVYERHKSGAYHLHCIVGFQWQDLVERGKGKNKFMDSKWLRDNAKNLGMGYMTHADNIPEDERGVVAFYVTKYMTKIEEQNRESWGRVRRIQTSRGIKYNNTEKSAYDWTLRSGLYLDDLDLSGEGVYLINEKRNLDTDDFIDGYVWPPDEKTVLTSETSLG